MLLELVVENYAVVDRLRVRFHPGLNLLTGETGSGKSLVVDALGLLFGGRAAAEMVRSGEPRARVAGIFDVRDHAAVRALLEPAGFVIEDGELLIERELLAGGKSRAFLGSRPVAAGLLRDLAPLLGDIHGQHDQQLLFSPEAQRDMLDAFADNREPLARIAQIHAEWCAAGAELSALELSEQEKLRLLDLWEFQRREIESAGLAPGEDAALENERRVLMNLERLQENAGTAYEALYDSPASALALVQQAGKKVDDLARIDPALSAVRENLETAAVAVQEASYALRDYLGRLEANPGRLEEIESRLAALDRLKRKYGRSAVEILAFLAEVCAQIETVEHAGERMEELRARQQALAEDYQKLARELIVPPRGCRPPPGTARRGGTGRARHGAHRLPHRTDGRPLDGRRRGPRRLPGLAQPGRGAEAARKGGLRGRNLPHRPGRQDVPGGAPPARRLRPAPHFGFRRGGYGHRRQRGGRRRPAVEAARRRQPGALRNAPGTDRLVRRPPLFR